MIVELPTKELVRNDCRFPDRQTVDATAVVPGTAAVTVPEKDVAIAAAPKTGTVKTSSDRPTPDVRSGDLEATQDLATLHSTRRTTERSRKLKFVLAYLNRQPRIKRRYRRRCKPQVFIKLSCVRRGLCACVLFRALVAKQYSRV